MDARVGSQSDHKCAHVARYGPAAESCDETRLSRLCSSLGFETHSGQDRTEEVRTAGACGNEERLLADCQGLRNTHTRTLTHNVKISVV